MQNAGGGEGGRKEWRHEGEGWGIEGQVVLCCCLNLIQDKSTTHACARSAVQNGADA